MLHQVNATIINTLSTNFVSFQDLYNSVCTHQLLRERATERYKNCCDEVYPLADGHGRAGIFIFDL